MINILLEGYKINAPWLFEELKKYIKPSHKVAVVAFSFRDLHVRSVLDWNELYGREKGKLYGGIVDGFKSYGIVEDNIYFVNYFSDSKESAARALKDSDIIYFTGGLPDKTLERINEFGLYDIISGHKGIIMGYSAGAVLQLSEYHLSPDHDYPEFDFYKGLSLIDDFYLEVHYTGSQIQNESIQRVLSERKKTVYATSLMSGAIIVDNGEVKLVGDVKTFR